MRSPRPAIRQDRRSGFATAFFSLLAFAFLTIGAAQFAHALQRYTAERAKLRTLEEGARFEGMANMAVARLLAAQGDGPFVGEVVGDAGAVAFRLEREDVKLSAKHLDASAAAELSLRVPDRKARERTQAQLSKLVEVDAPERGEALVEAMAAEGAHLACALSAVSPVAGGESVPEPHPGAEPQPSGYLDWRAGQRWRISLVTEEGRAFDRWVLLTGAAQAPALEIMRAAYPIEPEAWRGCWRAADAG